MPRRKTSETAVRTPRKKVSERPEHVQFILLSAAAYLGVAEIRRALEHRYGEDDGRCVSAGTIANTLNRYPDEILKLRKEMQKELQILNPKARLIWLNDIARQGIEGMPAGMGTKYDYASALAAIRLIREIEQENSEKYDYEAMAAINAQKDVIREYLTERRLAGDERSEIEILRSLTKEFGDYRPALEALMTELTSEAVH